MKVLSIISIVICSIGLLGGVMLLIQQEFVDGILGLVIYGYFMFYSIKVMIMLEKGTESPKQTPEIISNSENSPKEQL